MQLSDYVGQQITILIPRMDEVKFQEATLHGVEVGGIWVEIQNYTNELLSKHNIQATPQTAVFFFPYHEIAYGVGSIPIPGLNEKAFGV